MIADINLVFFLRTICKEDWRETVKGILYEVMSFFFLTDILVGSYVVFISSSVRGVLFAIGDSHSCSDDSFIVEMLALLLLSFS